MKNIYLLLVLFLLTTTANAESINGTVEKTGQTQSTNRVVDAKTNMPVDSAKIHVPQHNYSTQTDKNGAFTLQPKISKPTIISVEKSGYKPFSLTIKEENAKTPITIGIEKTSSKDIIIEQNMIHLGDDNFSPNSANAEEFKVRAAGPFYSSVIPIKKLDSTETAYLIIGSIIGVDTYEARQLKQSGTTSSYSSPPEIFFNGQKISEIKLNGDRTKVKLPQSLIKQGKENEVTIKTGRNLFQTAYTDYDDIEFMNLYIEVQ